MGVSTHFFAFDPAAYAEPPTVDSLLHRGDLDEELEVQPQAIGHLAEVPSRFTWNKVWNRNLAGDAAWSEARPRVAPEQRVVLDHWLSHLFWWAPEPPPPACTRAPLPVGEQQVVYDAALLEHILSLACPLEPVGPALVAAFGEDPTNTLDRPDPWTYDPEGFADLVHTWTQTLSWPRQHRPPGWSLLRWVWL